MLAFGIFVFFPLICNAQTDCSKDAYNDCVRVADPLIKEPHLIFPDNINDIDLVCRTWNRFVDCLKQYTEHCFTEQQRREFNKAVENPIESVHQMCRQPNYQKEYLQYAPCIKSTITQPIHCGPQYNLLVEQVSQGEIISKATLCCSHDRFKQCVLKETRRLCDRGIPDGPALKFSKHLIEKALSFMQDQCITYIANSGDCHTSTTDFQAFSGPFVVSTASSEIYSWSTIQEMAGKEILPSKVTPPRMATTTSWLPSSSLPIDNSEALPTQSLGSRSRPASFGRASSWSDIPNTPAGSNTVQMYPELSSTQSSRPDWATINNWTPQQSQIDDKTSTTWYPAAGNQLSNHVEEPNQQGLTKPKNNGARKNFSVIWIFGMALFLLIGSN